MKSIKQVIEEVAKRRGHKVGDIVGPSRVRELVLARHEIAATAYDLGYSTPAIGRALGGRDHSTILSLLKRGRRETSVATTAAQGSA